MTTIRRTKNASQAMGLLAAALVALPGCYGVGQALGEAIERLLTIVIVTCGVLGLGAALLALALTKKHKRAAVASAVVALLLWLVAGSIWFDLAGPVAPTSAVVEVMPGNGHACLRFEDGRVGCVGSNHEGALGTGGVEAVRGVAWPEGLDSTVRLFGNGGASCAQSADGELRCWGTVAGEIMAPRSFGRPHDAAVFDGVPWTLEQGSWSAALLTSRQGSAGASQLAFGTDAACARYPDGTVSCRWAHGGYEGVPFVESATQLAASMNLICAVVAGGQVLCWDVWDVREHRRSENAEPVETLPGLQDVVEIVAGREHLCARRSNGTVECWGDNGFGQLGVGDREQPEAPTRVVGLTGATGLHADHHTTCATRTDGRVSCWGLGIAGLPIDSPRVETRREGAIDWTGPRPCHPTPGIVRFD